jgi:hypothetical protein
VTRFQSGTAASLLPERQILEVLSRRAPARLQKHRPLMVDRGFRVVLRSVWARWSDAVVIVKPETVIGWHRAGFAPVLEVALQAEEVAGPPRGGRHFHRVDRGVEDDAERHRLQRHQSGPAIVRTHLHHRSQSVKDPRERGEPGCDRHETSFTFTPAVIIRRSGLARWPAIA